MEAFCGCAESGGAAGLCGPFCLAAAWKRHEQAGFGSGRGRLRATVRVSGGTESLFHTLPTAPRHDRIPPAATATELVTAEK